MAIATFDYTVWSARYPELASSVGPALASSYFDEAGLYLGNDDCSIVPDVGKRGVLLNMITAHIAKLNAPIGGQAPAGFVGRVTEATEGSVTVKVDAGSSLSVLAAWYAQTPYGAAFWAATGYLRRGRYVPRPDPLMEPFAYGLGRRGGRYW
jgi:hypothetical protein